MTNLAMQERYEEAGAMRDSIEAISSLTISSNIDLANTLDLDIFAIQNGLTTKKNKIKRSWWSSSRLTRALK